MVDRHWPIDALPSLLGLAETLYHRRLPVDPDLIERIRSECAPWKNRFATAMLELVEGIACLCDGRREKARGHVERARRGLSRTDGIDIHLCAGLAAARAADAFDERASHAAEVYHKALSNDRLRFAEEAAELLGDLSADAGNHEGAERWYQEARRVFTDRRSEWLDDASMREDLQRRDAALRDKAHPKDTASREEAWFRRLLEIERRLNSQAELDPILKMVMDGLVEITGAERGYLVLVQGGKMAVRARRNMDKRDPDSADLRFSRSVVEKVHKSGELFHSLNAPEDPRLTSAVSVKELGIRSILCLPLQTGNRRVGVVYLDNRHKGGVFETVNLERVEMFREKAALAMYRAILEDEVRELKRERDRLSEKIRLEDAVQRKPAAPKSTDRPRQAAFEPLAGESKELISCLRVLERAAATEAPVLILGETGTGKELAARAVHDAGARSGRTFLAVNCAAISATMLEAELFGNVRGAFTGADRDRAGLFQAAHRGTLFLDEIGEMSPDLQAKLLRALESKEVRRVGSATSDKVDVRIIAASNQDLTAMAKAGSFRSDLLYRLKVLQASLPPLRNRKEDIPLLVDLFLQKSTHRPKIDSDAMRTLMAHDWPGNVRELRHAIESLATLNEGRITAADVRRQLQEPISGPSSLHSTVEQTERDAILHAIRTEPSISAAARKLGIVRSQLYRLMSRYKIRGSVENSVSR
jgi:transcriptional regulator with GAF, ATPase, and Fis domain